MSKLFTQELEETEERKDYDERKDLEEQPSLLTSKEMSRTVVNKEVMKVRRERAAVIGQSRVCRTVQHLLGLACLDYFISTLCFFCHLSFQFLSQKEFRDIRLQQIAAQLEPCKGKKRQIRELMAAEAEDALPQK